MELLRPHIQFNGYFGQHEVVLASVLGSSNKEDRKEGLGIIIKLRKKEKRIKWKTVRKVRIPQLNLLATKLTEMVDLEKAVSCPPTLFEYSNMELEQFLEKPCTEELPCTTTAMERGVKLTTEAATMVSWAWNQDMVI